MAQPLLRRRGMRSSLFRHHFFNVLAPAAALLVFDTRAIQWTASVILFFGLFSLMHDALHGSLRLPRAANELLLSLSAITLGVSGHATRWFHLRHHADPFGPDDVEGLPRSLGLPRALLRAGWQYLSLPLLGWRRAPKHTRRAQLIEWLGVGAAAIAVGWSSPAGRAYLAVVGLAQLTIPIWAAWLPHDPDPRLVALLRPLVWTRSPLVLGFVFHELHHARPRLSMYELPAQATSLRPSWQRGATPAAAPGATCWRGTPG